jgi:hypothetical protein
LTILCFRQDPPLDKTPYVDTYDEQFRSLSNLFLPLHSLRRLNTGIKLDIHRWDEGCNIYYGTSLLFLKALPRAFLVQLRIELECQYLRFAWEPVEDDTLKITPSPLKKDIEQCAKVVVQGENHGRREWVEETEGLI